MTSSNSHSLKEEVISLLNKLPEDVTLEEIMYHLYVKRKIIKGKEDLKQGNSYSQEEIEEMAKKW
jgi:hypothetical protein